MLSLTDDVWATNIFNINTLFSMQIYFQNTYIRDGKMLILSFPDIFANFHSPDMCLKSCDLYTIYKPITSQILS